MQNSNFSFQILDPKDETQCKMCQNGTLPDREHSKCMELPEKYLRLDSFWAIGAMTFALIGIIMTIGIFVVFIRYTQHYFLIYSFDTDGYMLMLQGHNHGNILAATSVIVGRICPPPLLGWDRVRGLSQITFAFFVIF